MLRPDEVSDTPDEERARMFAVCERAIDEQLRKDGLTSRQAYQAYESGRVVPTIDLCERLAAALGVAPAWLAGWE